MKEFRAEYEFETDLLDKAKVVSHSRTLYQTLCLTKGSL